MVPIHIHIENPQNKSEKNPSIEIPTVKWNSMEVADLKHAMDNFVIPKFTLTKKDWAREVSCASVPPLSAIAAVIGVSLTHKEVVALPVFALVATAIYSYVYVLMRCLPYSSCHAGRLTDECLERQAIEKEYKVLEDNDQDYLPKEFFQRYLPHMSDKIKTTSPFSFEQLSWTHQVMQREEWESFLQQYAQREPLFGMAFQIWLKLDRISADDLKSVLLTDNLTPLFRNPDFFTGFLKKLSHAHVGSEEILALLLEKLPIRWDLMIPLYGDADKRHALRLLIEQVQKEIPLEEAYGKVNASLQESKMGETQDLSIRIGDQVFEASRALLIRESGYFAHLLNGGFKETGENEVLLKEADPKDIAIILDYLKNPKTFPFDDYHLTDLVKLADFYDIASMKSTAEELLLRAIEETFTLSFSEPHFGEKLIPFFTHLMFAYQYQIPRYKKGLLEWLQKRAQASLSQDLKLASLYAESVIDTASSFSQDITQEVRDALLSSLVDRLNSENIKATWTHHAHHPDSLAYEACVIKAARDPFETARGFDGITAPDLASEADRLRQL